MTGTDSVLGVILAGGLSRRMNGREKSLLELEGEPLIVRVSKRLGKQVPQVIINANGNPERFSELGLSVQPDTVEGFAGPLAGVLAGMRWAERKSPGITRILTVAADTPFFPQDYAEKMIKTADAENAEIALAGSGGRHHPVFGLWPVKLANKLEAFLVKEEGRKVMLFVERFANCRIDFGDITRGNDPFFNVNTPGDLADAKQIAKRLEQS